MGLHATESQWDREESHAKIVVARLGAKRHHVSQALAVVRRWTWHEVRRGPLPTENITSKFYLPVVSTSCGGRSCHRTTTIFLIKKKKFYARNFNFQTFLYFTWKITLKGIWFNISFPSLLELMARWKLWTTNPCSFFLKRQVQTLDSQGSPKTVGYDLWM